MLTCVTGVSGSGKSTLVNEVLFKAVANRLHRAQHAPRRPHSRCSGSTSSTRSSRSTSRRSGARRARTRRPTPACSTSSATCSPRRQEARARGYKPGRFSFNVKGGRCEVCRGDGQIKIEMHFLPDVYVPCEQCHGKRYNRETLDDPLQGQDDRRRARTCPSRRRSSSSSTSRRSAAAWRRSTRSAWATSASASRRRRCRAARRSASSWPPSCRRSRPGSTLYILDEPTTGLHFADVERLLDVLQRLVDQGNSVVVIEHNLDVIKTADRIIDMGPEGGDDGGARGRERHAGGGRRHAGLPHRRVPDAALVEPVTVKVRRTRRRATAAA